MTLPAFSFLVGFLDEGDTLGVADLLGLVTAGFSEVSGLETVMTLLTLQEGGVNDRVHRLPGRFEVPNVTLTRGMGLSDDLWTWVDGWRQGKGVRRTVFVIMQNELRLPLRIWAAERAIPVHWTGPTFNASSSALAIEKLELAPEKITLVQSVAGLAGAAVGALRGAVGV